MYVALGIILLALLARYDAKGESATVRAEDRKVYRSTRLLYQALSSEAAER